MVNVTLDSYGVKIVWKGELTRTDLRQWMALLHDHLDGYEGEFGVLSDATEVIAGDVVPKWAIEGVLDGQRYMRSVGMRRSCVLLTDAVHCARLMQLADSLGRLADERYVDVGRNPRAYGDAVRWITEGVEPAGQYGFSLDEAERLSRSMRLLTNASLEEVLRLAHDHALIEGWARRGRQVTWHVDGMVINASVEEADRNVRRQLRAYVEAGHALP